MHMPKYLTFSIIMVLSLTMADPALDVSARPLAITAPGLGTANSFAVLAGSAVNDSTPSTINGDVGLSPAGWGGSALTCAEVAGSIYSVDTSGPLPCRLTDAGLLTTAKNDLATAYDRLAGGDNSSCTTDYGVGPEDLTTVSPLGPGVYCVGAGGFSLSGSLVLSGSGVWIFRSAATIITASDSSVTGGDPCSVWWRAETSATLGTGTTFVGNLLALASIIDDGGSTVSGRLLARNQAVTLNNTTIIRGGLCAAPPTNGGGGPGGTQNRANRVVGLPNTGGAPIRNEDFPGGLVVMAASFGAVALVLGVRAYRRNHLPKR